MTKRIVAMSVVFLGMGIILGCTDSPRGHDAEHRHAPNRTHQKDAGDACCGGTHETAAETPVSVETPKEEIPAVTETPIETVPAEIPAVTENPIEEPTPVVTPTEIVTPTETPIEEPTPVEVPTEIATPTETPIEEPTPVVVPTEIATPTETPIEEPTPVEIPAPAETPSETPKEPESTVAISLTKLAANAAETGIDISAQDIDACVKAYLERVEKAATQLKETTDLVADLDAFVRDSSALAIVALASGISGESTYKKNAASLMKAAVEATKATDAAAAAKTFAAIQTSLTAEDSAALSWSKIVPLPPVMKAVPNISSSVNRIATSKSKLEKGIARVTEGIATMAILVQGSVANVDETIKPDAETEWIAACHDFRDKAIAANKAARAVVDGSGDFAAFEKLFQSMNESCNDCHKTFHPTGVTE